MERRNFLRLMGAGAAMIALKPSLIRQTLYAEDGALYQTYEKVQLVGADGKPVKAAGLKAETSYIFTYPHVSTPCLLLKLPEASNRDVDLKTEDGKSYLWKGGVGPNHSIVAYTAICPHQLTHPNRKDSFFSYIATGQKSMAYQAGGVIVCGSHLSAFDPKNGGSNLSGPAPHPLASVVLEHAEDDTLWAVGVLGQQRFHDFFKTFKRELKEEFGNTRKAKKLVSVSAPTVALSEYTQEVIQY